MRSKYMNSKNIKKYEALIWMLLRLDVGHWVIWYDSYSIYDFKRQEK